MKNIIVLNGSPRRNYNTAKLLKEAMRGAKSTGANVEYFDLYDYNFKGCMSCFSCQKKGSTTKGLCAIKDDIRPILEKCINSDGVIMGSPIYFSYPTGVFRCFLERLLFATHTYMLDGKGGTKRVLDKIIPTGVIFTMNLPENMAKDWNYPVILEENVKSLEQTMGYAESLYSYDTCQFDDFSKYNCDMFEESQKKKVQQEQFPIDMKNAFNLGKKLAEMSL